MLRLAKCEHKQRSPMTEYHTFPIIAVMSITLLTDKPVKPVSTSISRNEVIAVVQIELLLAQIPWGIPFISEIKSFLDNKLQ